MWRKRIDFRDAGHGRDERGTDRSTGADKVAAVIGVFHQFMRDIVQDAVAVLDDGRQFLMQAILHNLRQILAVNSPRVRVAHFRQRFIGTGNFRIVRFPFFRERLDPFAHIRDFPRIRHDDFFCFFRRQIRKFVQHFLRRPDVNGRVRLILPRFHPFGQQNVAIDLVFFEKEMRIGRRTARKPGFVRDLNDFFIERLHIFDRIHFRIFIVFYQKCIVSNRLHFEIIIKFRKRNQFFIRFFSQNGTIKFAHDTSRAIQKPVMHLLE